MKIHVICCNDSIEYAVIESKEFAEKKLHELSDAFYEASKDHFGRDRLKYLNTYYWHIHTVEGE